MTSLTRRAFVLTFGTAVASLLGAACAPGAAPSPTPANPPQQAAQTAATGGTTPLATAAAAPAQSPSARPALQSVRIGLSNASAADAGIYISDGLGFFADEGVQLQYVEFGASSEIVPSIARNDIDIGESGMNPALFNALARNISIKLVCDNGSEPAGFGWTALVVDKSKVDQIKGPADLKGRKIALTPPGLGTASGYALPKYLARANLTPNDVDIVPLAFPDQLAALAGHSIDVAFMVEPFTTNAIKQGIAEKLAGSDEFAPDQQVTSIIFTDELIQGRRDTATRWVTAYLRGIRVYNAAFRNNQDKDRVIEILTAKTNIKDKQLWSEIVPVGLRPDGSLNVASIQDAAEFFSQLGLVQSPVKVADFIDTSFLQAANAALGPAPVASPSAPATR